MTTTNPLAAYLPMDRRWALLTGKSLPEHTAGTVLFADMRGFTRLGETLAQQLGSWQGAEELNRQVNACFGNVIATIHSYSGSIVRFSGDAILAVFWGQHAPLDRATAAAVAILEAMRQHPSISLRIGLGGGEIRRRLLGDPAYGIYDLVSGPALHQALAGLEQSPPGGIGGILAKRPATPCPWPECSWEDLPKEALRSWVSPEIHDRLTDGGATFVAELRQVAPLFLHVDCSETELIQYVPQIQAVLHAYGGRLNGVEILDKGPLLVALFGAPIARGDDPIQAAGAALALLELGRGWSSRSLPRVGLSIGPLYAGLVGNPSRMAYTVYGDEMNLAARLMEAARAGEALASDGVRQAAKKCYHFTPLGSISVKGRSESVPIARIEGEREFRLSLDKGPLVGRRRELAHLATVVKDVWASHGRVIVLNGEAGIGKSRLAAALLQQWRERGGHAYIGQTQAMAQQQAYFSWNKLLRQLFGLREDGQDEKRLANIVASVDPTFLARLPLLGDVLGLSIAETALTRSLDARLRQASTQALIVRLLQAHSEPLLLVLEDVQWMDGPSWELTRALAWALTHRPILLCLTSRPMEHPPSALGELAALPSFKEILLGGFSPDEAVELACARLGVAIIPPVLATFLQNKGQGNPFFIQEILHALKEEGFLQLEENEIALHRPLNEAHLPDNVRGVVLARIDRLAEPPRLTLKVASVIGRVFAYLVLRNAHPVQIEQDSILQDQLDQLQTVDIVLAETPKPNPSYIFKHAITHDVAYSTLLFSQRRELHGRIANYYESQEKDNLEPHYSLLAYHYGHSGDRERQLYYCQQAGQEAARRYANSEAIAFYTQALEILSEQAVALQGEALRENKQRRWKLLARREALYNRTAQRDKQRADVELLHTMAQDLDRTDLYLKALYHQLHISFVVNDYNRAQAVAQQLLSSARDAGDPAMKGKALHLLGRIAYYRGHCQEAQRYCHSALDLLQAAGDEHELAHILNTLGLAHYGLCNYGQALVYFEQSRETCHRLGDYAGQVQASSNTALVLWDCGQFDQSLEQFQQVLTLARQIGHRHHEAHTLNNIGDLQRYKGQYEQALGHLRQAIRLSREINARALEGECLNNLGRVYLAQNQFQRAREYLQQSLHIRESLGEIGEIVLDHSFLARTYLGSGKTEQALEHSRRALALIHEENVSVDWSQQIHFNHYRVCHAAGLSEEAQAALEQAYRTMLDLSEGMPQQGRRSFLEDVQINREIAATWEATFDL